MLKALPYDNFHKVVYLDYAAATPTDPEITAAMMPYFDVAYGNPSSMHRSGRRSRSVIEDARARIAEVIGARREEVIFTGSGTEGDNLAVLGAARAAREASVGAHVIVSAIEHKAVLEAARRLKRDGFEIDILPVDSRGLFCVSELMSLIRNDTVLVSVMLANNEIGTILPVASVAAALKRRRADGMYPLLHTDACQAAGYLSLHVYELGVDLMTLNGSKIYGPKGIGVLFKKEGVSLDPLIIGGEQEQGIRAGTESVPLAVGMSEALVKAERLRESETARLRALREYFVQGLRARIPEVLINGHPTQHLPNNVHITVPKIEGEAMVLMLDEAGIEAATGSACSAFDLKPSHVLLAIGHDGDSIHGSVRFSLGRHTTQSEIDYVLSVFPAIVSRLKSASALTTFHYARENTKTTK